MKTSTKFSWKAFVSFYIAFSFLVLGASGIVLYVAPPGRVANWSIWRLVALTKAQWQAVHTIFALVFLVAASVHLYFNWKVLVAYVRTRLHEGMRMKRELALASGVGLALLVLTIAGAPPFSTVMDVGDDVKNAWAGPSVEPPIPHAEELTIDKLAETVKLPAEKAKENLSRHGVKVEAPAMTVKQIAESNRLTPQEVYRRIQSDDAKAQPVPFQGGGWGRKTVEQVCAQYSVPVETGLERLKTAGYTAEAGTALKDLALGAGKTPIDVAKVIAGPDATIAASAAHQPGVQR
jgi:hypothetical protein